MMRRISADESALPSPALPSGPNKRPACTACTACNSTSPSHLPRPLPRNSTSSSRVNNHRLASRKQRSPGYGGGVVVWHLPCARGGAGADAMLQPCWPSTYQLQAGTPEACGEGGLKLVCRLGAPDCLGDAVSPRSNGKSLQSIRKDCGRLFFLLSSPSRKKIDQRDPAMIQPCHQTSRHFHGQPCVCFLGHWTRARRLDV